MVDDLENENTVILRMIVKEAPPYAGVYFWKDEQNVVLYVGKAINIKSRLTSYFSDKSIKTQHLLKKSMSIEWIVVDNEYEALVLENNLIKQHQPRYNIHLKDQKSYPYIRITNEPYPRIFRTRNIIQDGSEYFGPYPDVEQIDLYLGVIKKILKLRKCTSIPLKSRQMPSLYYHMNQCLAPCAGLVSREDYALEVDKVRSLLRGEVDSFIKELTGMMSQEAINLNYEQAAQIRDTISAIKVSTFEQKVEDKLQEHRDYIGFTGGGGLYCFVVLRMRHGKMVGKIAFKIESPSDSDEVFNEFLISYYRDPLGSELPSEVFIETIPSSVDYERFFKEESHINLKLALPIEERDVNLLRMAFENATLDFMRHNSRDDSLKALKEALSLPRLPKNIEGFDVAQLNGHFTVASLVSFKNGLPNKANYRRFRMKSLSAGEIDDFKAISEAVTRRFTRLLNEGLELPDLLLIDGGKGQVSSVYSVLSALGLADQVPLAGLAKKDEEIFRPNNPTPILLEKGSLALRLCQAVRDETHRVATTYNQQLRASTLSLSNLENIRGIGPQKAKTLLKEFGSLQSIMRQPVSLIASIAKIPLDTAEELLTSLVNSIN